MTPATQRDRRVRLSDGRFAYQRSGGLVTQADINRHGSYAAARKAKDKSYV